MRAAVKKIGGSKERIGVIFYSFIYLYKIEKNKSRIMNSIILEDTFKYDLSHIIPSWGYSIKIEGGLIVIFHGSKGASNENRKIFEDEKARKKRG